MIPPRAILAAVNFSDSSRAALVLAARLARHCAADLHVLHAEDPLLNEAAAGVGFDLASETRQELRRFVAVAWPAGECAPRLHVTAGEAVTVILDVAHRQHADVIVVGTRNRSRAERVVFRSTADALLRRADVSVLITPAAWLPPDPAALDLSGVGPLIAAVDVAGDPSAGAGAIACALAAVLGTSAEIVRVTPDRAMLSASSMLVMCPNRSGAARAVLTTVASRVLSGASVPVLMYIAEQFTWL